MTTAGVLALVGVEAIDPLFSRGPGFAFQPNRRALVQERASSAGSGPILLARATNLLWLGLAVWAILTTCRSVSPSLPVAMTASAPFALAPQLLFAGATFGNDAAVTGLTAAATAMLVRVAERRSARAAFWASLLGGLGLWAKASAAMVAPAIGLVFLWLLRDRCWKAATALLLPGLLLTLGWVTLEMHRIGNAAPLPLRGYAGRGDWFRLLTEPDWVLSVWAGFWAKLGWFNVVFPWPVYFVFVPSTLLVLLGLFVASRSASTSRVSVLLGVVPASGLSLLLVFMVRVDWQPQGRLLLPASAAMAGLATLGLSRFWPRLSPSVARQLPRASLALATVTALGAIALLAILY